MIDPNEKIRCVELIPHNPEWATLFSEEARKIKLILKKNYIEVHHIGGKAMAISDVVTWSVSFNP